MRKHLDYVQGRSAHGTAYQEHKIPKADQERIAIATSLTHHRSIVFSDLCPEHAAPSAGVAVVVQQPAQAIKLKPRSKSFADHLATGRVALNQLSFNGGVDFDHYNLYGWTGGHENSTAANRTGDILASISAEAIARRGTPALITADLNADTDDILQLGAMLTHEGWTDVGATARRWGARDNQPTCWAPNAGLEGTRRDYMFANVDLLPMIVGFGVCPLDDLPTHATLQLLLRKPHASHTSIRTVKPASLYGHFDKVLQARQDARVAVRPNAGEAHAQNCQHQQLQQQEAAVATATAHIRAEIERIQAPLRMRPGGLSEEMQAFLDEKREAAVAKKLANLKAALATASRAAAESAANLRSTDVADLPPVSTDDGMRQQTKQEQAAQKKTLLAELHADMDAKFIAKAPQLQAAIARCDTKTAWRSIARLIELAFTDALGLDEAEAAKVSGHGKPKFKKIIPEPRGIDGEPVCCTPQGSEALRAAKQEQRCSQIADRIKRIVAGPGAHPRGDAIIQEYLKLNAETCAKLLTNLNTCNEHEQAIADRVSPANCSSWQHFAFFRLHERKFADQAKAAHCIEVQARVEARSNLLQSTSKKGHKAVKTAIDGNTYTPLTCLIRDAVGPQGQAVGTFTCDPTEVDAIARRCWGQIYAGNSRDLNETVESFIRKHGEAIFTADAHVVEPITGDSLRTECINARHSAGGLDHFDPADFTLLSPQAYHWLAMLLNSIEDGADWPEDILLARASFLAKDRDNLESPLSYRILLIMPVLYRRWASCRLHSMQPWIKKWQLEDMFAGVPEVGAEDAWWETAVDLEAHSVTGKLFAGGALDIFKCFDQIVRPLAYRLAKVAGMPVKILDAYMRYQENLRTTNAVAGGLGLPYQRPTGIPQGCPMSMMIIAIMFRPWIIEARRTDVKPRGLADDILVIASGEDRLQLILHALEKAQQYIAEMGARVAAKKSILFSNCKATRLALKKHTWRSGEKIPVVKHARDLGAHISTDNRAYSQTLRARVHDATRMVLIIHRLPVTFKRKAAIIRTKAIPKALYGCEAALMHPAAQLSLTAAIKQAISPSSSQKATDLTFVTSSHGHDLDPETIIFVRRLTLLRRMTAKRPRLLAKVQSIYRDYASNGYTGTDVQAVHQCSTSFAPMLGQAGRQAWKPHYSPFGPIGIILMQLHEKAAAMDSNLCIHMQGEPFIDVLRCPFQELRPLATGLATRARTEASSGKRAVTYTLFEVDAAATQAAYSVLDESRANYRRVAQNAGSWGKDTILKTGYIDNDVCDLCGTNGQNPIHSVWHCPALHAARTAADPDLACISSACLPPTILIGIAPALAMFHEMTFWGEHLDDEVDDNTRKLLGITDCIEEVSRKNDGTVASNTFILTERAKNLINRLATQHGDARIDDTRRAFLARQCMAFAKHVDYRAINIIPPARCTEMAPDIINTYSDGCLHDPSSQWYALGGAGVWSQSRSPLAAPPQ